MGFICICILHQEETILVCFRLTAAARKLICYGDTSLAVQAVLKALRERETQWLTVQAIEADIRKRQKSLSLLEEQVVTSSSTSIISAEQKTTFRLKGIYLCRIESITFLNKLAMIQLLIH